MDDEDKYLKKPNREKFILLIGLLFVLIITALFVYQHFHPDKPNNTSRYNQGAVPAGYNDLSKPVADTAKKSLIDTIRT